ncbi:extracellular solute-binding protein [Paenibacillus lignilyticus]|uniref:Extracellular solute-binding protein n=1 Tax=Paenibacillus lignilyticus TaxID=1172615 RepID=A0ABS5CJ28_9BACL|nr:extracellular solute-binding protein [Paenibacillus lignilyticus]MBP3965885.1 extracellular solute-binding protein [Paenibacillus lignilyticus]
MARKERITLFAACLLTTSLMLSACGGNNNAGNEASKQSTDSESTTANNSANTNKTSTNTDAEGTVDPFGKYDPPITVHSVRMALPADRFENGDTNENNVWTREYESALGIKLEYDWLGDPSGDSNKLDISIASNDIPDVFGVTTKQMNQLVEGEQIQDLTEVWEKYASPALKELGNQDGGLALKAATFDGKLMAIPKFGGNITSADILWIRTDWMEKLGMQPPKTMDELLKISEAFMTKDPDGNGKDDTFGLAISKELSGLTGFYNGFHAYPGIWVKDATGKLTNGNIAPEMKTALAELQKLYKAGFLDKEFAVKDGGKVIESISQNKVGIYFGANWYSYWPFNDARKQNPGMEWKPFPIVSADDKPAIAGVGFPVYEYYVAKDGFEHPEVIVKMLNLWLERAYGQTADWTKYSVSAKGTELFQYPVFQVFAPNKDVPDNYLAVKGAVESKDTSALNPEQKSLYEKITAFMNGDQEQWATYRQAGPTESSFEVLAGYKDTLLTTGYLGANTPTMVEKQGVLDKLQNETFTKIIMGAAPIEEFDKFVEQWKKLGGDQITSEVNDWAAKQ